MANDHYVPRFYLKNFQIENQPGMIYSYMRGMKPRALSIKKVASEEEYYTLKSDGVLVDRNFPDEFLTLLESNTAPVLKKLLTAQDFDLYLSEHFLLAWFIAYLANRTPFARKRLINADKALWKKRIRRVARDKETFHSLIRRDPQFSDKAPDELEGHRLALLHKFDENLILGHSGPVDDHFLEVAFKLSEELWPILLMKKWMILECPTSQVFVTSDNPVILLPPPGYFEGMRVGFDNAPILFPLSPKRALLISNLKGRGVVRVWGTKMDEMVSQTITYGHKSVFSNINSQDFQEIFDSIPEGEITKAYFGQK
jgi:hypothetical protein